MFKRYLKDEFKHVERTGNYALKTKCICICIYLLLIKMEKKEIRFTSLYQIT